MKRRVEVGVVVAGLTTTVLPAANAGATFIASNNNGKFQAVIKPQTPIGSLRTCECSGSGNGVKGKFSTN